MGFIKRGYLANLVTLLICIEIIDSNKVTQSTILLVKILKENVDTFADFIYGFFKYAHVTPVFKKVYRGSEENCLLPAILPVLLNVGFL